MAVAYPSHTLAPPLATANDGEKLNYLLIMSITGSVIVEIGLLCCVHTGRDAMFGAARLHVKSMQRRGQTRIRSDGAHEAVDAARITRLRRLNGATLNARVPFFQLGRQIQI